MTDEPERWAVCAAENADMIAITDWLKEKGLPWDYGGAKSSINSAFIPIFILANEHDAVEFKLRFG